MFAPAAENNLDRHQFLPAGAAGYYDADLETNFETSQPASPSGRSVT
jgi:hypothetical protein